MIQSAFFLSDSASHDSWASQEAEDLPVGFPDCCLLLSKCIVCLARCPIYQEA